MQMAMNPNAERYYESAQALRLPVAADPLTEGFHIMLGGKNYYFFRAITPLNNATSAVLVANKYASNSILRKAGIPVPSSAFLESSKNTPEWLAQQIAHLKYPMVVKPMMWTGKGRDVVCNIPDFNTLIAQCDKLGKAYPYLLIEEFHVNPKAYRVFIFRNKILDIIERVQPHVVADGIHRIQDLIKLENEHRKNTAYYLAPIEIGFEANRALEQQKYTLDSIPSKDKIVILGYTNNASRGGNILACSEKLCDENIKIFRKIVKTLNLEVAGIDFQCKDLQSPLTETNGVIIEVNHCPSVRIHEDGIKGSQRAVTKEILKALILRHPFDYINKLLK